MNHITHSSRILFSLFLTFQYSLVLADKLIETEDNSLSVEQDLFSDFSVASATRLAQSPRDIPVSVTIITRKMIEASSATEIPDLFRLVPGFKVGMYDGSQYSVIGHGMGDQYGRKFEVLIDGMPVQSPVINIIDWLALPIEIDDIEYIEVVRGTSVAVYGANAFEGAINIITKRPFEEQGSYYRVLAGDPDVKNAEMKYGFLTGESSHTISAYYKENTGFSGVHDSSEYKKIRYRGDYSASVNDSVEVMLGFSNGFKQEEGDGLIVIKRPRDTDTNQQYVRWSHRYENENELTLKAYHHYVKYDDTYQTELLSTLFGISPALVPVYFNGRPDQRVEFGYYTGVSNRYAVDVQQSFVFPSLRFVVGAGLLYDDIESKFFYDDAGKSAGLNKQLFSNLEWQIRNDLVLNMGAMFEVPDYEKGDLSSRLSLNYHLNNSNTFRVSVANSYKPRTVYGDSTNLVSRYVLDGTIFDQVIYNKDYTLPERIESYELSHLAKLPDYDLSFDWRIYNDNYIDQRESANDASIVDGMGNGAGIFINAGDYTVKGFEMQLKYEPSESGFVSLQYSSSAVNGFYRTDINPDKFIDYSQIDVAPKDSYGILLSRNLAKSINLGLNYIYVNKVEWFGLGDPVPSYRRLDANITSEFKIGKSDAKLSFIAQNILDDYAEFAVDNIFDTRLLLKFSLEYF